MNKGIANLPKPSVVVVSQIAKVDKSRLLEKIDTLALGHLPAGAVMTLPMN